MHAEDFKTTVDFLDFIVSHGIVVDFLVFGAWGAFLRIDGSEAAPFMSLDGRANFVAS